MFKATSTRQPTIIYIKQGCDKNGKLLFRDIKMVLDNGAYTSWGATTPFVIGDMVQGGLYAEYPSLAQDTLVEGDLCFNNDFRGTYATLLEKWMGLDAKPIVGGDFEQFDFV